MDETVIIRLSTIITKLTEANAKLAEEANKRIMQLQEEVDALRAEKETDGAD